MGQKLLIVAAAALLLNGCVLAFADECDQTALREGSASADGATRVRVIARAGSLQIDGMADSGEVRATGTACATSVERLDEIELSVERRGDEVVVEVEIPEERGWSDPMRLDLVVSLPDSLPVIVDDTSGPMQVSNVAALEIEDGSGEIAVEGVAGNLKIEDGSGEIVVRRVGGDVEIDDGSGPIDLMGVTGGVRLEDGSGEIQVRGVGLDVEIEEDGSGPIDIADVTGSVIIREDGSGSIDVAGVGGDLVVERDGSGGINHRDISGRVEVPVD